MKGARAAFVVAALLVATGLAAVPRTDYHAVSGEWTDGRLAWRAWTQPEGPRLLVVDPATLVVSVVPGSPEELMPRMAGNTAWDRLRTAAAQHRTTLENAGLRRGSPARTGAWLTFDLCPSTHPLDRGIFTDLERDATPLPVFLEVSGRWMETHPADLDWLTAERDAGRLAITWVNHSEHHRYVPDSPWSENFLLLPGTDLNAEVFAVEQRLLDRGEMPSVFFRFPGLISSPKLVDQVLALQLVPLAASSWLAKQQSVVRGGVVLTHANGNEPEGLVLLERWDRDHRSDLEAGRWHWLGLDDWRNTEE